MRAGPVSLRWNVVYLAEGTTRVRPPVERTTPVEPGKNGKAVCECGTPGGCGAGKLFTDLQNKVHEFLSNATLADAVVREAATATMQFDI